MRRTLITRGLAIAGLALALMAPARAELLKESVHELVIQGQVVPYRAVVERTRVTLDKGPAADIVSTAYLAGGAKPAAAFQNNPWRRTSHSLWYFGTLTR